MEKAEFRKTEFEKNDYDRMQGLREDMSALWRLKAKRWLILTGAPLLVLLAFLIRRIRGVRLFLGAGLAGAAGVTAIYLYLRRK